MKTRLLEVFADMIEQLPAQAVLGAIERERQMLKDDLLYQRVSDGDVTWIFRFCEFIRAVTEGDKITPAKPPEDLMPCFRKTVLRLVLAGELPARAVHQFGITFPQRLVS